MTAPEITDDDLMIQLQSGESRAFDVLMKRYQRVLIGFFLLRTFDIQYSEDLAQETLLRVYSHSWDYLPLGRFKSWMFRIGRNLLIDRQRKSSHDSLVQALKHQPKEEQDFISYIKSDAVEPLQLIEQQEVVVIIEAMLAEIPDDQSETFHLHHIEGLSLPEVAEVMGVPTATSKSRLRLAREKLAEKLRSRGIGPILEEDE